MEGKNMFGTRIIIIIIIIIIIVWRVPILCNNAGFVTVTSSNRRIYVQLTALDRT